MDPFMMIKSAIDEYRKQTNTREKDMIIVMSDEMKEMLLNMYPITKKEDPAKYNAIFGVEVMTDDRLDDEAFGIFHRECKDHIHEHITEMLNGDDFSGYDIPDGVEWIQCDLCEHPLSLELAVGCDITCPWCGDVNDLDDRFGGDDE
jgi:hypothetical protein